jgi:hypothetical protein
MSKLEELRNKQAEIEAEIKAVKKTERVDALKTVKTLCKEYGFTEGMLKDSLAKSRKKK